jgi:PD-(D/E)XK endonuclease
MPNKRTYTDEQLRAAVRSATCWADVVEALGKPRRSSTVYIQPVALKLRLDTSHFNQPRSRQPLAATEMPFTKPAASGSQSGLCIAARWFLDRGYTVSVPLEPAQYDLVTESDEGLKRIQIKTCRRRTRGGRYDVRVARRVYDPSVPGSYRVAQYDPGMVDFFFIITQAGTMFLIPLNAVAGLMRIVVDDKYAAFMIT